MPAPTPQQAAAIAARGHVLVMAGAGAGKTSTLVTRILDRVLDATDRVALDRILVVTFNEAAAAEMRHRLGLELEKRHAANPADSWLAESAALLEISWISTLHAFCLRLVREHFLELGLDPRFSVLDETGSAMLRGQVMDEVLRGHYRGDADESECVRRFLRRHAADGDRQVREWVLRVHEYARSLPEAERWLASELTRTGEAEACPWHGLVLPGLCEWATGWTEHLDRLAVRTPDNPAISPSRTKLSYLTDLSIDRVPAWLDSILAEDHAGNFPRGKGGTWRKPMEGLFEEAVELRGYFAPAGGGEDPISEDWRRAREDVRALLVLVRQFMTAFESARRAAAAVDFSDLEQLALRLLWDPERGEPTDVALAWQHRFDHVFVDEYQDINGAQDRILCCVSRSGSRANRFLVGDVKQSIYRFRRADPRIFQDYARRWRSAPEPGGEVTCVLPLSENFRSHEAILAFVNGWFEGLMRTSVGGVAYDAEARLRFGAPEARATMRADPVGRVEVHLQVRGEAGEGGAGESDGGEGGGGGGDEDEDTEEVQAGIAARRLREWHDAGLQIWDSAVGAKRTVKWSDMVVLHPGPRPVAERWARRFMEAGVPLEAKRGGFFEATEISDLLNLARLLDNPLQDQPLLAVLRSPLVGLSLDELAALRLVETSGLLWEALELFVGHTGPVRAEAVATLHPGMRTALGTARPKLVAFHEEHGRWRRIARDGSLSACFETVLAETAYEAWLVAQPRADGRLANLRRLLALARQFDAFQRHGLFRFLRQIEAQQDAGVESESAPAVVGDRVRLLSMHQSKGLEFPIVVVAGLGRRFNLGDLHRPWLLDEEFGVCPPVLAEDELRSHPSLPRWLAGVRQRRETMGEQTRLLYVACTRAVERLVLLGAVTARRLATWDGGAPDLSAREVARASDPLSWLGPLLGALTEVPDWAGRSEGTGRWLNWRLHFPSAVPIPVPVSELSAPVMEIDPSLVGTLRARLDPGYGWPGATRESAKAAVTALRKRWAEPRDDEFESDAVPVVRPGGGLKSSSPEAVERGLVHHLFCELFDLGSAGTPEAMRAEAERMRDAGWFGETEFALLDFAGLSEFWDSELGATIRSRRDRVERELPFTARLRAREAALLGHPAALSGMGEDDFQVIQGVVDLAVIGPEDIWLVDFKTDRLEGPQVAERAAEYRVQLALYAHALTAIYRRPVTRRWLYFLSPRVLVSLDPPLPGTLVPATPGR